MTNLIGSTNAGMSRRRAVQEYPRSRFRSVLRKSVAAGVCIVLVSTNLNARTSDEGQEKGLFLASLVTAIGQAFTQSAAQGAGCVFSRMFSALGAPKNPNCDSRAETINAIKWPVPPRYER
jgi:hypothetical protein